ncbi:MAG: hypothetical protein ACLPTF_09580 [Steroidobacteraceae bacterium]
MNVAADRGAQSLNIDLSQFFAFKAFDIASQRRKLSVVMQAQQLMAGEPGVGLGLGRQDIERSVA